MAFFVISYSTAQQVTVYVSERAVLMVVSYFDSQPTCCIKSNLVGLWLKQISSSLSAVPCFCAPYKLEGI